ncbi:hypothetical protein K492DRAFT_197677 [Lichtheimia hyalospora FSU 10163]|nr:hypothetical protein K492DRAFT_197677 [Lichtheimia hyalospora FSU 10163]
MVTTPTQKPTKRLRSKKCCIACRERKIRCNVDDTYPCRTCIKNKIKCHVSERRRSKKSTPEYLLKLEERVNCLEQRLIHKGLSITSSSSKTSISHNGSCSSTSSSSSGSSICSGKNRSSENEGECHTLISSIDPSNNNHDPGYSSTKQLQVMRIHRSPSDHTTNGDLIDPIVSADDGSNCISDTNISRWQQQRLNLFKDTPLMTLELADAMIEYYFRYIHRDIPIISKIEFLRQYYFQYPHVPDKCLLYAICTLSCHFIIKEKDLITKCNATANTIRYLHCCLESKALKVLESVFRRPSTSSVCTLLLLASVNHKSEMQEENWLQWMMCGTAIRIAQNLGFHNSKPPQPLGQHEIELRRRIWFYACCTDREISIGAKRPWMILGDNYDFEMPTPYEIPPNHSNWTADVNTPMPSLLLEAEEDLHEQRPIYVMFIYSIPFIRLSNQIMSHLYSTSMWNDEVSNQIHVARLLSKELDTIAENTIHILRQLNASSSLTAQDDITTYAYLKIYQLALKLLIYRYFISDYMPHNDFESQSLQECTVTAIGIIDNIEKIEMVGPSSIPWISIGSIILQAASVFAIHAASDNDVSKRLGSQNLTRCASIYLRDDEQCGSWEARILVSLVEKYSSSDPMQYEFGHQGYTNDSIHVSEIEQHQHSFGTTTTTTFHQQYPPLVGDARNTLNIPVPTVAFMQSPEIVYTPNTSQQLQQKAIMSTAHQIFDNVQEPSGALQFRVSREMVSIPSFMTWDEWDPHL